MKLFGTDGIRGKVGEFPITPSDMRKLGYAIAKLIFKNWIWIELFNVFRMWIYIPIEYRFLNWISYKIDRLNIKIAPIIGTSLMMIDMVIICGLEIFIVCGEIFTLY